MENSVTSQDLLNKILDYNYLWNSASRIGSKPSVARLKQIEKLLDVFGLSKKYADPSIQIKYTRNGATASRSDVLLRLTNLQYFRDGEFLNDRPTEANKELIEKALSVVTSLYPDLPEFMLSKTFHTNWLFNHLMRFRQEIYNITYPASGMDEGFSVALHYSLYLEEKLKRVIGENLNEIDEILCLIIDPAKRTFDKEQINYPNFDLDSIDREWRIENY